VLSLGPDNTLRMDVPPEFASLRTDTQKLPAAKPGNIAIKNRAGEIVCEFKAGRSACGLELRTGTTSLFAIQYQGGGGTTPSVSMGGKTVPLSPNRDGLSSLHLFVDGSVIETLVDGKEVMTARCYALSPGGIQVAWTGAADAFSSIEVSSITPISKDRLTS
jgi:hypothetical protein